MTPPEIPIPKGFLCFSSIGVILKDAINGGSDYLAGLVNMICLLSNYFSNILVFVFLTNFFRKIVFIVFMQGFIMPH